MSYAIQRILSGPVTVSVGASEAASDPVPFGSSAGGMFIVTAASGSPITLQWWAATGPNSEYRQLHDALNSPITTSVQANRAYAIPDELFGSWGFKAVGASSATATLRFHFKG